MCQLRNAFVSQQIISKSFPLQGPSSTKPGFRRQLLAPQGNAADEDRVRCGSAPKRRFADDGYIAPQAVVPPQAHAELVRRARIRSTDKRSKPSLFGQLAGPAPYRDRQPGTPILPPKRAASVSTALSGGHRAALSSDASAQHRLPSGNPGCVLPAETAGSISPAYCSTPGSCSQGWWDASQQSRPTPPTKTPALQRPSGRHRPQAERRMGSP